MFQELAKIRNRRTGRVSSWDTTGYNRDSWRLAPGESRVLADLRGPGCITHIWMTQLNHYRECLLRFYWDGARQPSIECPLGDFFGLGHGLVNSYQSLLFSASTNQKNAFNSGCALNAYLPMPFRNRAVIELVNESTEEHTQYFYIDFESLEAGEPAGAWGYLHAEFRRTNPFGGWAEKGMRINNPETDVANLGREAWKNNYVILETQGRGHYLGCNLSVTNLNGGWWGEGDDMIWVDGYKWPPDLHGTGSEDYLNQAWGMQANAFLRNGSSIYEPELACKTAPRAQGGYQTSYVFHLENPVRFQREVKVTIEHGHGNHLSNEMSSVAYWYAQQPTPVTRAPKVQLRLPILRDNQGRWILDPRSQVTPRQVPRNAEMRGKIKAWKAARRAQQKR